MSQPDVRNWADVQGLVRSGYTHLPYADFVLFRIGDADWARLFVASLLPEVTPGNRKDSHRALNIAFSFEGLRVSCGLSHDELASFPPAFIRGMARARRQSGMPGRTSESAPEQWFWGGPHRPVHGLLARRPRTRSSTARHESGRVSARLRRQRRRDGSGAFALEGPELRCRWDLSHRATDRRHVDRSLEYERPAGSWSVTVREPADSRPIANGHGVLRRARTFGHRGRTAEREPEPSANRFTEPVLMFLTLTAAIEREFELVRQNDVVRGGEYFFLPGLRSLERLVKTPAQR